MSGVKALFHIKNTSKKKLSPLGRVFLQTFQDKMLKIWQNLELQIQIAKATKTGEFMNF